MISIVYFVYLFKFKSVLNYVYLKFFERFSMRYFDIQSPALDATRLMFKELDSDKRTSKIDLGIGIYRDEKGEAPVFKAVKKAETLLLQTEVSKSYKTPAGNSESVSYTHLTLPTICCV